MGSFNDMESFYDSCNETRTPKQIVWEEGIYKEGSFRQRWAYNFGRNGFYKFGKKIASFFVLMLLWIVIDEVIPFNAVKMVFHTLAVVAVNIGSVWLFRQTCADKKITGLNIIYFVFCGIFAFVFYKYMDFLFGYLGYCLFLSLYYGIYFINKIISPILRLGVSLAVIYNIVRNNIIMDRTEILSSVVSIISIIAGVFYKYFTLGVTDMYYVCLIVVMLVVIMGFILYIRTKNKFLRNVTILFAIISLMEILGSNAVAAGIMEHYIRTGVW
ncbi:MAG: hypothetical protein Q4D26_05950 [Clostridia bacterium]|nr:hypothetical protein [Clostridia bacterium]